MEEKVILVDEHDKEIGEGEKMQMHREGKLHRSFSIFIFNSKGEMLLQLRAKEKYHSGGLWTNTCCGHPRPGEKTEEGAHRRLTEEMGFDCELKELLQFTYKVKLDHDLWEHEFDHTFIGTYEGEVKPNPQEADGYKWIYKETLLGDIKKHPNVYTEWFKIALEQLWKSKEPKVMNRKILFESKKFRIIEKDMEFAGGEREQWEVVEQKGNGGARVLALTANREIIFIREYRGAAEKYVLRLPTGLIEDGEDPKDAASRELEEETGFLPGKIESLGKLESTNGYYMGPAIHLFFGTDLKETGNIAREPGEQDMEVILIPLKKAFEMAINAEFEDVQTVYALLLFKKYLSSKTEAS